MELPETNGFNVGATRNELKARAGRGLGFSAQHLVDMPMYRNDEAVVGLPLSNTWWCFAVAYPATHLLSQAEQAFLDYCTDRLK